MTSLLRLLRRRRLSPTATFTRCASVWSFGDNSNAALGHSTPLLDAYEPTIVPSLPDTIASVAAGHYHSLAVTDDGGVWAWGRNEEAQLGRGSASPRNSWSKPERVEGLDHVRVRAAFGSGVVSAAIDVDGCLWVWGRSKRGQLGLGKGIIEAIRPSRVEGLIDHHIVKVSFGWGHALAQTKDGRIFGWGYAEGGRLGQMGWKLDIPSQQVPKCDGRIKDYEVVEKLVAAKIEREKNMPIIWEPSIVHELDSERVVDVACGLDHSLVLLSNGMLLSSGDNTYGQLGRKTAAYEMLPVEINLHPMSLSAGLGHSLLLCKSSSQGNAEVSTVVLSWGWNRSSQLGRQGPEDIPGAIEGLQGEGPVFVSAGRVHSLALTSKGEVWSWGSGRNGRLGLGSSLDEPEPALVEGLDGLEVMQAVAGFDHNLLLVAE